MLSGDTIYPVNFDTPGVGTDHGGNRVFNWQDALSGHEAAISFEAGETDYSLDPYSNQYAENPDLFVELVNRFEYTDSAGMHYVVNPTDGYAMLLLKATEGAWHYTQAFVSKELGAEFTGGSVSFDWFFISDMAEAAKEYANFSTSTVLAYQAGIWQESIGKTLAQDLSEGVSLMTEDNGPLVLNGTVSGWQTQAFVFDENTVYDAVSLHFMSYKDESWDSQAQDDSGDAYLLIDNIQIAGLNEMMQFGQIQDAAWNESVWMMGVA